MIQVQFILGAMIANPNGEEPNEPTNSGSTEFAYEADLKNYLAKNLHIIEPGLKLYEDEGVD